MQSPMSMAKAYLTAFDDKNVGDIENLIGESFRFEGPIMKFEDKRSFIDMADGMTKGWDCRHENVEGLEQGDQAVLRYDFVMASPVPQTVHMVEWYRVRDGQIEDIRLMFDSAKFIMPEA